VLIEIDPHTSLARARRRNDRNDSSESRIDDEGFAFHDRVRVGYRALAESDPERFAVIDGRGSIGEVAGLIREALRNRV
jgi:dTMP kinase